MAMMKNKQMSSRPASFAKGGSGNMIGKMSAGSVKSGHTMGHQNGGGNFAKGGSGHMVGKTGASPAKPC